MSRRQQTTLVAAILGSGIATIDGTVVNVGPSEDRTVNVDRSGLCDRLKAGKKSRFAGFS